MSRLRPLAFALAACLAGWLAGSWWIGGQLTRPLPSFVPAAVPPVQSLAVMTADDIVLDGWLQRPAGEVRGVVLLLHGLGGNLTQMWSRAPALLAQGYAVGAISFRGQGGSEASAITLGWRERLDVLAAATALRREVPGVPLAVVGMSLGGAAALMAMPELAPDALVLELVYPDLERALCRRLRHNLAQGLPCVATRALTWQLPLRWGIGQDDLSPVRQAARVQVPVLVIGGAEDPYTPPQDTRALAAAFPAPARLWLIDGLGHGDPHAIAGTAYTDRLTSFLNEALAEPGGRRP